MAKHIRDFSIHHAGIKPVFHPRLKTTVNGQTAVRYLRFAQTVQVDRLELAPASYGRWAPCVPLHPAHLIVSVLDPKTGRWKMRREVDLPRDPRIEGTRLTQRMRVEQMDVQFAKVLKGKRHRIELGGLKTDHLRVECDREHSMWPNHGECNGGQFNVPFGILNSLKAMGRESPKGPPDPKYLPVLALGAVRPVAPKGMKVSQRPFMLRFEGEKLSVGFSLRRPMLVHLGWDALAAGKAGRNRLLSTNLGSRQIGTAGGVSGPSVRTLTSDCFPHHWTGEVSVHGNQVRYHDLRCVVAGIRIAATFTVEPERLLLELTQTCDKDISVVEAQAWRLAWDIDAAMTGAAAMPTLRPGRNGEVELPMLWAGDGVGCLSCQIHNGPTDLARFRVESYRSSRCVTGGLELGPRPEADACQRLPAGTLQAKIEWAVTNLEPRSQSGTPRPSYGLQSNWASMYSCFRPEYGGFSNQSISVNCHVNQHGPGELVVFTRRPKVGPNPLDLFRFTIGRALLDGGGYGYWRTLYLDSDPILLSGAGRIHQAEPSLAWLRRIEPALLETVKRMLGTIGKEGLAVCRALSGNAGSYRWSSNAMDVVGFGHMDAYVNAWTYRGLRNATAMLHDLGRRALSQQCRERAAALKAAFPRYLVNPKTGWVVGWRSRDGQVHDYAFTWTNSPACAFGLLDRPAARRALLGLEHLREKVSAGSGVFGIPANLRPLDSRDHILPLWYSRTSPTFEFFTDGSMSACCASYYLRALSICGLKDRARTLARQLDQGYAEGLWCGGNASGVEFRSWEGLPTGYEGTFVLSFGPLYGMAIEQGLFDPPQPEWWPAGG